MKKIPQKKSLGQHFLRAKSVLELMCKSAEITAADTVLEIGPGEGTLTAVLLEKGATVIALEKDRRLIPHLMQRFADAIATRKLYLKEIDTLDFNPSEILVPHYKIVANIPYYITGAILEKFLSCSTQPTSMTLLVQKEVARRITAKEDRESLLSISVKAYGEPDYVKTVSRQLFSPPPKVDSAILIIRNISKKNFKDETEERTFFKIVKEGFSHKRKMLKNNLSDIAAQYHTQLEKLFGKAGIDERARAEELHLEKWLILAKTIQN